MFNIPCIIFAGGKSSRMGEDKSLLPFGGYQTLTEYQHQRLKKIFKNVYISCKEKSKFNFDANFIEDIQTDNIFAPTVGFVSIFKELEDESFFILSVDTPFVELDEIRELLNADNKSLDATIARTDFGMHPLCGVYHRSLEIFFMLMLNENNHKLGMLLKSSNTEELYFKNEKSFKNLNYFSEYKEALQDLQ